jgi:hypothetical protein
MPYSETGHLYWDYEKFNIFQRETRGIIIFNITIRESGQLSIEYVFNIHTTLMKNWDYYTFHYQFRDQYYYTLSSDYTSFIRHVYLSVYSTEAPS